MTQSNFWARLARTLRGGLLLVVASAGGALAHGQAVATQLTQRDKANAIVREALDRKVYGLDDEHDQLLDQAAQLDPTNERVQWQRGRRRTAKDQWVAADAIDAEQSAKLKAYRDMRARLANTANDHLFAADWCKQQKLPDHERAHLLSVLDLVPNHEPTLLRLGYRPVRGGWESPETRAAQAENAKNATAARAKWEARAVEIRDELIGPGWRDRRVAGERLKEITDPAAIAVVEAALAGHRENHARVMIEWLCQFNDPRAAEALARFAVTSRWSEIRELARRGLRQYPLEAYAPAMLASLRSPVAARVVAKPIRGGIDYDLVLSRETQDAREREELNTIIPSATFAADLQRDNARTLLVNQAVSETLCSLTSEKLPAEPQVWWQWWDRYNEVYVEGEKPIRDYSQNLHLARLDRTQRFDREEARIAAEEERRRRDEQAAMWSASGVDPNGNPLRRKDCLAAGTPVWTIDGPVAVEQLQIGDMVLAQDVNTGELAHKIVLRTTVRKKSLLINITTATETFATSGGHPFWVVGRGWVKARQIQSGDLLHTLHGTAAVSMVEEGDEAETYNLIVDDFSSYFIGQSQALTHDNTPRAATAGLVPGMRDE
jgi:hypothetical protein